MQRERIGIANRIDSGRGAIGYIPVARWPHGRVSVAAPSAIECILVTRWRGEREVR